MPIGLLYSGTLWLGNSAYLFLSVSFIQMLKVSGVARSGPNGVSCAVFLGGDGVRGGSVAAGWEVRGARRD